MIKLLLELLWLTVITDWAVMLVCGLVGIAVGWAFTSLIYHRREKRWRREMLGM